MRRGRQSDRARRRRLLHPRREVSCLADGGVIHSKVVADTSHDDLTRVEAHADLHIEALRPELVCVPFDGIPQP